MCCHRHPDNGSDLAVADAEEAAIRAQLQQANRRMAELWDALREAQEKRDRAHLAVESLRQSLTQLQPDYEECKAERDAAIEQAEAAERERKLYWEAYRRAVVVVCSLRSQAEDAQRDATEQRALAGEVIGYIMLLTHNNVVAMIQSHVRAIQRRYDTNPTEAHRSPQSGQEEGDDATC